MSGRNEKNICECYKRLSCLGIPIYKSDERYEYGEERIETGREKAFPVPELIRIDEKCMDYPVVGDTDLSTVFECMSQVIIGVSDFEVNLLSFWILDVFVEGLWTAQNAGMEHDHQKATLLWICYFFNYIFKRNPTRKEVFKHLKEILFLEEDYYEQENWRSPFQSTGKVASDDESRLNKKVEAEYEAGGSWKRFLVKKEFWALPLPPVVEKSRDNDDVSSISSQSGSNLEKTSGVNSSGTRLSSAESTSEVNVGHMIVIIEILYRIFGRLWVYLEIQSSLDNMPKLETIDLPLKLHTPKPKAPPKSEASVAGKSGKKGPVGEKSVEEKEIKRELHKNDYILPLQDSEEAKGVALQLFGPPPGEKKGKGDKTK